MAFLSGADITGWRANQKRIGQQVRSRPRKSDVTDCIEASDRVQVVTSVASSHQHAQVSAPVSREHVDDTVAPMQRHADVTSVLSARGISPLQSRYPGARANV